MNIFLREYSEIQEAEWNDYIKEWAETEEGMTPSAARKRAETYEEQRALWDEDKTDIPFSKGFVPSTLWFLTDSHGRILGAIHLRHELNERLTLNGGHIGYGVRPSERNKGYGTRMLQLLLDHIKTLGYKELMLTCDDWNKASAATMEKCGAVLIDKPVFMDTLTRRYSINLT